MATNLDSSVISSDESSTHVAVPKQVAQEEMLTHSSLLNSIEHQ